MLYTSKSAAERWVFIIYYSRQYNNKRQRKSKLSFSFWFPCFVFWDISVLRYVIPRIYYVICVICISKKLKYLKGIKNWKITYYVILSVLSNKTNLILRFSSPLKHPEILGVMWLALGTRLGLLFNYFGLTIILNFLKYTWHWFLGFILRYEWHTPAILHFLSSHFLPTFLKHDWQEQV